jgi:hypothetical protein
MSGITLTAEQIRAAPPEVRLWLEQQIAQLLGLPHGAELPASPPPLIAASPELAAAILGQIQNMLPVMAVFFELGREQGSLVANGLRAFRLADVARQARLASVEQVLRALAVIDAALRRAAGNAEATLHALDGAGHVFVADATSRSILALWQQIVAARGLDGRPPLAPPTGAVLQGPSVPIPDAAAAAAPGG